MQEPVLVFFYGTLKRGHYNYERFKSGLCYLQSDAVDNYSLVEANPYYPHAVVDVGGVIYGEVFQVMDERTFNSIDNMELGAGYKQELITTVGGKSCIMYLSTNKAHEKLPKKSEF